MARKPREVIPEAPHHIYLRGNNRRRLFSSKNDRLDMLGCLRRGLDTSECLLHQLTLMTNHVHLIVTPPRETSFAVLLQRTNQRYAQMRNKRKGASGKLFEERPSSKPILDDGHLMVTTLYNDVNAFRQGMVDEPLGHEWSTGPLHAGRAGSQVSPNMWTPSAWYLGLGDTPEDRSAVYEELVAAYLPVEHAALVDDDVESEDAEDYKRRVERPNGSTAREVQLRWRKKR